MTSRAVMGVGAAVHDAGVVEGGADAFEAGAEEAAAGHSSR